jgi:hypothetical protein
MQQLSNIEPSLRGIRGRDISLQSSLTHIQKQYLGDTAWENLVAFNSFAPNAIRKTGGVFLGNTQFKSLIAQISYPTITDNIVGLNLSFAGYFWLDMTDDVDSFDIINTPNNVATFTLIVKQHNAIRHDLNFNFTSKTLKWAQGYEPASPVASLNQIDIYTFSSKDQGQNWFSNIIGLDFKGFNI